MRLADWARSRVSERTVATETMQFKLPPEVRNSSEILAAGADTE